MHEVHAGAWLSRDGKEVAVLGVTLAQWSTMEGDSCRVGSRAMEVTVLAKRRRHSLWVFVHPRKGNVLEKKEKPKLLIP